MASDWTAKEDGARWLGEVIFLRTPGDYDSQEELTAFSNDEYPDAWDLFPEGTQPLEWFRLHVPSGRSEGEHEL